MVRKKSLLAGTFGMAFLFCLLHRDSLWNSVVLPYDADVATADETIESSDLAFEDESVDRCRYQAPLFSGKSRSGEVHLVFFGKPIMQALWHYCVIKQWKMSLIMNATNRGLKELERISSSPKIFTVVYTTSRTLQHSVVRKLANSTHALVSAIRYCFKITGAKKGQLEAFRAYFHQFGCKIGEKQVMPLSFLLDSTKECLNFFKYASHNPDTWWVLKKSHGYGGVGISIHSNLSALHHRFALCKNQEQFIVQKYLPGLMLIDGRKFDVRALIVIASTTPYMLFYHDGYLRLSLKKFSSGSDKAIHLTNSHIQTQSKKYSPDKHYWSFGRLQEYLDKQDPSNGKFVAEKLVPFIKKVALFILQAGLSVFERHSSSFQLLGLDFLVTSNYRVWFIEANNYPLWPKPPPHRGPGKYFIDELMDNLADDMFELVFKIREDPTFFNHMSAGQSFKSLQLIWSEMDSKCSHKPSYNPCTEFV